MTPRIADQSGIGSGVDGLHACFASFRGNGLKFRVEAQGLCRAVEQPFDRAGQCLRLR